MRLSNKPIPGDALKGTAQLTDAEFRATVAKQKELRAALKDPVDLGEATAEALRRHTAKE